MNIFTQAKALIEALYTAFKALVSLQALFQHLDLRPRGGLLILFPGDIGFYALYPGEDGFIGQPLRLERGFKPYDPVLYYLKFGEDAR